VGKCKGGKCINKKGKKKMKEVVAFSLPLTVRLRSKVSLESGLPGRWHYEKEDLSPLAVLLAVFYEKRVIRFPVGKMLQMKWSFKEKSRNKKHYTLEFGRGALNISLSWHQGRRCSLDKV
jgi:hypothetical protein